MSASDQKVQKVLKVQKVQKVLKVLKVLKVGGVLVQVQVQKLLTV